MKSCTKGNAVINMISYIFVSNTFIFACLDFVHIQLQNKLERMLISTNASPTSHA